MCALPRGRTTSWRERRPIASRPHARGVIFDLDGVLIDSFDLHQEALVALTEELGVAAPKEFHKRRFGTRTVDTLRELLGNGPSLAELQRLVLRKEAIFRDLARGHLTSPPGALELLRSLGKSGFQLAIGSSTVPDNVTAVLAELDLESVFEAVVTAADVGQGKPAPDIFMLAAAKLGLSPSRCVVVEDAVAGVEAGKRARCSVIAVTTSHPAEHLWQADRVVESMEELSPSDFDALIAAATPSTPL